MQRLPGGLPQRRFMRKRAAAPSASARRPSIEGESVGTTAAGGVGVNPPPIGVKVGVGVTVGVLVGVLVATPTGVLVGVFVGVFVDLGVLVGVGVGPATWKHWENSDVSVVIRGSPRGRTRPGRTMMGSSRVAVAVMTSPDISTGKLTLNAALQVPSVLTVVKPTKADPSPKSLGGAALQETLEKNSMRNGRAGDAVQGPLDVRGSDARRDRRDDGEVLEVVGSGVGVAGVVRGDAVRGQVDPERSIGVDRIADDRVAGAGREWGAEQADARRPVERDRVPVARLPSRRSCCGEPRS